MSTFLTFMVVTLAIYAVLPGGSQGWVGGVGNPVLPGRSLGWRGGLGYPGVFPGRYPGWRGELGYPGVLPGSPGWVGRPVYPGVLPGRGWVGGAGSIVQHKECADMLIAGRTPRVDLPAYCTKYLYPRNKIIQPVVVGW